MLHWSIHTYIYIYIARDCTLMTKHQLEAVQTARCLCPLKGLHFAARVLCTPSHRPLSPVSGRLQRLAARHWVPNGGTWQHGVFLPAGTAERCYPQVAGRTGTYWLSERSASLPGRRAGQTPAGQDYRRVNGMGELQQFQGERAWAVIVWAIPSACSWIVFHWFAWYLGRDSTDIYWDIFQKMM